MELIVFEQRLDASHAAASLLAQSLDISLRRHARSALIVSGGTSPQDCLVALSNADVDWSRVNVALTDEREVAMSHEASNAGMVQSTLMQGKAKSALLQPCSTQTVSMLSPCAAALVGMGADGHFASIFPDLAQSAQLLTLDQPPGYHPVTTSASKHKRMTANLPLLLLADEIVLLIFGQNKKDVLDNPGDLPVASLIKQDVTPVQVCWAP